MKKLLIVFGIIIIGIYFVQAKQEILIPKEAIRFRVIANSDSEKDQKIKQLVSSNLQTQISAKLKGVESIETARQILQENIPTFQHTVEDTLTSEQINQTFKIHYGMNEFPEKTYKGVTYKEGEYESLVVTLGDGMGKNWWCVLFPPICLLEAEEKEDTNTVEYKFFIKELIDKYF